MYGEMGDLDYFLNDPDNRSFGEGHDELIWKRWSDVGDIRYHMKVIL